MKSIEEYDDGYFVTVRNYSQYEVDKLSNKLIIKTKPTLQTKAMLIDRIRRDLNIPDVYIHKGIIPRRGHIRVIFEKY